MKSNRLVFLILATLAFVIGMSFYGRTAGESASNSFDRIVAFLLQDWLAPTVAIGMLVLGALLALYYLFLYWIPTAQSLESFRRIFAGKDPATFARDHEQISVNAGRDPLLGHDFKEFSETLLVGRLRGGRIASTARPSMFINYATLRNSSPGLRIAPALPGYFVGFGLLFTFIGLLAALYQASDAIGSPQVTTAQIGLQTLLGAATFKFWTSIAGLFVAMVLSFMFRWMTASLEARTQNVCRAIESVTTYAPPQRLQDEATAILEEQLAETRKFSSDAAQAIAAAISAQLERNLPQALGSVMTPPAQTLREASETVRVGNGDNAQVGEEIVRVVKTEISSLRRNFESFENGLEALSRGVSRQTVAMERVAVAMEGGPGHGYSHAYGDDGSLAHALQVGLAPVVHALRETAESLRVRTDESSRSAAGLDVSDIADRLAAALKDSALELRGAHEETRRLGEQVGGNLRALEAAWAGYRERFEHVDRDLEKTFERLVSQTWTNQQQAVDFLTKMNSGLDRALDRLGAAVSDIGRRTEELSDSVTTFVNRLPQAAE